MRTLANAKNLIKAQPCSGFTLIELLVVISVIGILAGLSLSSFTGAQKQARDSQRRSDLNQYRNALETYASANNGRYPTTSGDSVSGTSIFANPGVLITTFLSSLLNDPVPATYTYYYYGDGSAGLVYKMYATMETGSYWIVCSSGKSGKKTTAGAPSADSNCDI